MSETMTLKGQRRTALGTRETRKLRAEGKLPVVIYGHGETPETLALIRHDVEVALAHGARTFTVDVDGKVQQYLIKEVQYDHLASSPIHIDLTRFYADERVTVSVGIELRGIPKGAAEEGVLEQHLADIEVECLVTEIPETLHPVVTELGLGDTLYVRDLKLPPGVVAITDGDERVASVKALEEEAEAELAAESEESTAEPERIGRVRKDEEAEGEAKK